MHGEELRVSIDEYQGHKYVSLRVWAPVMGGPMGPVKGKGLSIKLRELGDVADALRRAADTLDGPPAEQTRQRQSQRPGLHPAAKPTAPVAPTSTDFDEFTD